MVFKVSNKKIIITVIFFCLAILVSVAGGCKRTT